VKSAEKKSNSAKVRRKKRHPCKMVEKLQNAVFSQCFLCRVSQKVGLLKRRVRSHVVRGEIKNCTPLWREARFEVKCTKHLSSGAILEVTMSKNGTPLWRENALASQNAQNTAASDHFLKFRYRKMAPRCGEKRICKSKC